MNASTTTVGISKNDGQPFGAFGIQWVILANGNMVDYYPYGLCGDQWTNLSEFVTSFPTSNLGLPQGGSVNLQASLGVGPNQWDCATNYTTGTQNVSYPCK